MANSLLEGLGNITRLKRQNYRERKDDICSLLVLKNLYSIVEEDERPPAAQINELRVWRRHQENTLALI